MQLIPLDKPEWIELTAAWLADDRNNRWLDFGGGVQHVNAIALKVMAQKENHLLRLFTPDEVEDRPIGVVGLSDINRVFGTATIWIVLGDKHYSLKGYAIRATVAMLGLGFGELGLHTIKAWAVDCNHASLRIIQRLGFRSIGRERQCHCIGDRRYDRLWFDMLASELR